VVVGAGLVGLVMAMDLARRGLSVSVVEQRLPGEPPAGNCNHVSARTMEAYRQLGIVQQVRDAGFPPDYPNDVVFCTTVTGFELSRIAIPSRAQRYVARGGPDTDWPTPEPPHRINQRFLNPLLETLARDRKSIEIIDGAVFAGYAESDDGVTTTIRHRTDGTEEHLFSHFLVGCDGGHSQVRRAIGAQLEGDAVVAENLQMTVRAPELIHLLPNQPAWDFVVVNPRRRGTVMAIDGKERWLVRGGLLSDEAKEDVDRDAFIRALLGVGKEFEYTIESVDDYTRRRLVADRFRNGRVFIAGDAAHIWPPTAGYGMNAGVADAMDLSWMLAAVVGGWASPELLDAYQAERHPLTTQVSHFVIDFWASGDRRRSSLPPELEEEGPVGEAVRARLGAEMAHRETAQYCCKGLNFGYFYDQSPIIAYDGESAPAFTMDEYTPSTVPGCRVPHLWMEDGRSLYDALGVGYSLLRTDRSVDVDPVLRAAKAKKVPMTLVDVTDPEGAGLHLEPLILVRPDVHVAWRGASCPERPDELIDMISGRAGFASGARTIGTGPFHGVI
jgi:2-polyprenyl-6-methoxyphenol hydroxylase-like FAD-dependent oxidoreductase